MAVTGGFGGAGPRGEHGRPDGRHVALSAELRLCLFYTAKRGLVHVVEVVA